MSGLERCLGDVFFFNGGRIGFIPLLSGLHQLDWRRRWLKSNHTCAAGNSSLIFFQSWSTHPDGNAAVSLLSFRCFSPLDSSAECSNGNGEPLVRFLSPCLNDSSICFVSFNPLQEYKGIVSTQRPSPTSDPILSYLKILDPQHPSQHSQQQQQDYRKHHTADFTINHVQVPLPAVCSTLHHPHSYSCLRVHSKWHIRYPECGLSFTGAGR